ncbi:MAG: transcription initiation factor IIB [Thermoproteus sp.]|nr:transcription initiation factor IIB [Thermoproteus sp.]
METHVCPICGNSEVVYNHERGEIVCAVCGAVISENLVDPGPEWRAANEKRERRRTGAPVLVPISEAFTTKIDWSNRDALGNGLDLKRKIEAIRLMKWQDRVRSQTSYERNLVEAFQEMERLRSAMGLPKPCVDRALEIYRQASERGLTRGQSVEAMAAAALYTACRLLKTPRLLSEFTKYTTAPKKRIARCYRLLLKELDIKVSIDVPILHISKIARRLGLSNDVVKTAIDIAQKIKERGLNIGKGPVSIAVFALYLAARLHGIPITQKEIAKAADTTEATIRHGSKLLATVLNIKNSNV